MKLKQAPKSTKIVSLSVTIFAILNLISLDTWAAAFALQEQSGSNLGTAFAGAAEAADASSLYTNPATMSFRKSGQIVNVIHFATPSMKYRDSNGVAAFNQPLGNPGGDAGSLNLIPNFYAAMPLNDRWTVGLGVSAPFGMVSKYNPSWEGRYLGIESNVKTVNVNPAMSFKATDRLSLGFGVNWQYLHARFSNAANYSAALGNAAQVAAAQGIIPAELAPRIINATSGLDSFASVKGHNKAWGFNGGALFEFNKNTRVSLAYRSKIKHKVEGTVTFQHPSLEHVPTELRQIVDILGDAVNRQMSNGKVKSDITLPAVANLSFFHQATPKLGLMSDLQWTEWSSIQYLTFRRIEGAILQSTPEKFRNTWRAAVGANYRFNDTWLGRAGVAFDQSPIRNQYRTPRLPDAHRVWFAIGGQYSPAKNVQFDFGFAYLHSNDKKIYDDAENSSLYGRLDGVYGNYATVASLQVTYSF
ncbi:MAG: outer membrane protein transport protein [Burkholderiales bacterium]|jgi:long-chain fatty acid transport protein|nr:outer membrane protein transport protein [Burkholderiales bacterium]